MDDAGAAALLEFLETADRLKTVYRASYLIDGDRHESSAEHSWHVSLLALLVYRDVEPNIDLAHLLELLITHDLVEIYAGDVPIYFVEDQAAKQDLERTAAKRLFAVLPPDLATQCMGWWEEFETGDTAEAGLARALDRFHGFSQNVFSGGRAWHDYAVSEEMTERVNATARAFDPVLTLLYDHLYERARQKRLWDEPT